MWWSYPKANNCSKIGQNFDPGAVIKGKFFSSGPKQEISGLGRYQHFNWVDRSPGQRTIPRKRNHVKHIKNYKE